MQLCVILLCVMLGIRDAHSLNGMKGFSDSCGQYRKKGFSQNGVYRIYVGQKYIKAFCEFEKGNPEISWLVFQKRTSSDIDFYKPWKSYRKGFGDYESNFWLGLENLHDITNYGNFLLRIDITDFHNNSAYAEYKSFRVGREENDYVMTLGEFVAGDAGDALSYHNNCSFSTFDRDNDQWGGNCALVRHGGWWYKKCAYTNLNGKYFDDDREVYSGTYWYHWRRRASSLKEVKMKIRRTFDDKM